MIIRTKDLKKIYKSLATTIPALAGVSIEMTRGEFVAITGKSGSGKSTLLYQLGLLDYPTSGIIEIDGRETGTLSSADRTYMRLVNLGYVFQDYAILPSLTALENVMIPLLMKGVSESEATKKAKLAIEKVGLSDRMYNTPAQLSGGQQQRVAIARAIGHDPKILFADEPTANLDSETSRVVLDTFLSLNKEGQTIMMVTHEPEYANLAGRIIHLADGAVTEDTKK